MTSVKSFLFETEKRDNEYIQVNVQLYIIVANQRIN